MSFLNVLRDTVEKVDGAVSAMIMGADGVFVEGYANEDILSHEEFGAESAVMLNNINNALNSFSFGDAKEVSIVSEKYGLIMRQINPEYYFAIVLRHDGNYGKGRFVLKTVISKIEGEF